MPKRNDWIRFEGFHATKRGVAMLLEARRLWHASAKSNGKRHPAIVQGGKAFAGPSAGTHAREAFDFDTSYLTNMENRFWEWCLRKVGFKSWWRPKIPGLWGEHNHAIPEGGDLSSAAQVQVKAFHNERNGLRSNHHDPTIGGLSHQTWEKYQASKPKPLPWFGRVKISGEYHKDVPYVSLDQLRKDWASGHRSVHVWWVQKWLTRLKDPQSHMPYYNAPRDGIRGELTWKAWTEFLADNKVKDPGSPNMAALLLLGKKAKTAKKIRSK